VNTAEPLLSVRQLTKIFRSRRSTGPTQTITALAGIDFDVWPHETLGLVGESGSGKSTAAYCVIQLERPTSGEIRFLGRDLTTLRGHELRRTRREMQIVFQDPYSALDPRMTVQEAIDEPLDAHGWGNRSERRARVSELLELVGLPATAATRYPHEFSGGQRQRIGIARALALEPRLVICDEPVSALDVSIQAQVLNLLKDLQDELGLAYLFISHDLAVVRTMSDRIAVMRHGAIIEYAAADEIYQQPKHEYTRMLLDASPIADPERARRRHVDADRQGPP
jgi:ABC-type oligopeptide transport system ATPase subunit